MDSKYVRKTVENLLAELERNPALGRRMSPSFMSRYGRPLGLGIALGVSGAGGCSGSSEESKDNPDALPADKDALPGIRDAYGISWEVPSPTYDVYVRPLDADARADTRDALPYPIDAYGIRSEVPYDTVDVRRVADTHADLYGIRFEVDTRDVLPYPVDAYGIRPDAPVDTRDAPPVSDAGADASSGDADPSD